jgi:hypothetical protein
VVSRRLAGALSLSRLKTGLIWAQRNIALILFDLVITKRHLRFKSPFRAELRQIVQKKEFSFLQLISRRGVVLLGAVG